MERHTSAFISVTPECITLVCPAKVNLFLEVMGKRADGFHELQTLIITVNLYDTLTLTPDPSGTLNCFSNLPGLPTGTGNLVVKAANALQQQYGLGVGMTANLTKRIPHEAGLGGGSADAAMTLVGLNKLWNLKRSRQDLQSVAAKVGSDVAAFLTPPASWCTGRGEIVEEQPVGGVFHLVLVKPPFGCATADVYRKMAVPGSFRSGSEARLALAEGDPERLAKGIFNRLQNPAIEVAPELRLRYDRLLATKALACWVTGSGSTVVALCQDASHANTVAAEYRNNPVDSLDRCWIVRTNTT